MNDAGQAILDLLSQALSLTKAPEPELEPSKEWMTVRTYAARLSLHPDTVRRYIRQGLPAIRCGRGYRVRVFAADKWLAEGGAIGEAARAGRGVLQ